LTKPILVIKFGTASITHKNGDLNEDVMADIARQVANIHDDYHIVMVSSGAVAAGKKLIKKYSATISERKAAAAIGNPLLLNKYAGYFEPYGIHIAQSLCERQHFSNRNQFLQLKSTYEDLWANGIIPIANENDVVSNLELKFSDNDELATLIAVGFGASVLLFSTSVPGVLDADGNVVPVIRIIDKAALGLANKEKSTLGLGGMVSKLTFARLATRMGIKVVIFGIGTEDGILNAILEKTGTLCYPQKCAMPARKKWLASGSLVTGSLQIDAGACKALQNGHSLLAVGVRAVIDKFEQGEVFEIQDENNITVAVGRSKISSDEIAGNMKTQKLTIANADDIVLL
jgi:glutamate 5-kinase